MTPNIARNTTASLAAFLATAAPALAAGSFNHRGNILIADQFNNRVIEVTPAGEIAWSFGTGGPTQCTAGPGTVIAPNDAERLAGGLTLIAGTGTSACPDNRVIIVDQGGRIVFQYGRAGVAGNTKNRLNVPVFALQMADGNLLITDQANNRIIAVDLTKRVVYKFGAPSGHRALNSPNSAEVLASGNLLIADENNNRFIDVDPAENNRVVRAYTRGLSVVAFASRLANGNTLVADSGNNRVVEIAPSGRTVFRYATNTGANSNPSPNPSGVVRTADGNTLIADQFNDRVIMISPAKRIIFQYGMTNIPGIGPNQLNAPYSAVVIGDYTGLTPPPGL